MTPKPSSANAPLPALCFFLPVLLLSGCKELPPTLSVIGAYIPDWVFCIIGGIIAMALVRAALDCTRFGRALEFRPLLYTSLAAVFSCLAWLVFF